MSTKTSYVKLPPLGDSSSANIGQFELAGRHPDNGPKNGGELDNLSKQLELHGRYPE